MTTLTGTMLGTLSWSLAAITVAACSSGSPEAAGPGAGGSAGDAAEPAGGSSPIGEAGVDAGGSTGEAGADTGGDVELIDDWAYSPSELEMDGAYAAMAPAPELSTINIDSGASDAGFATGGAMDANNFWENIAAGYLPTVTDITHEGIFYGYFFDRGQTEPCTELFCPTYSQMLSTDILSDEQEYYLSVGLSSGLTEADMQRKQLNLVVVLDISGSMRSPFDQYYYDQFGNPVETQSTSTKSKMQIAREAVVDMLDHLKAGDRFGMVLFDDTAYLAKPLSPMEKTDMGAIADHILELEPQGGTNMEAGFREGTELLATAPESSPAEYENRIIFLTDAMPNTGDTSETSLLGMAQANAEVSQYTTFIGIGVDFNTTLTEAISKVRGANYYSVHSEEKFKERMDEEFEYMVTPLVFDLELKMVSAGFEIEAVYGSPEADQATGVLMRVNTLFPAASEGGQTRGGIVLLKLRRTGDDARIELSASYENREGEPFSTLASFDFDAELDVAPNTGIQKAILLSRYVNLMQEWIRSERQQSVADPALGEWEQTSLPLSVSPEFQQLMQTFLDGFIAERERIGDDTLQQEEELLQTLIAWQPSAE